MSENQISAEHPPSHEEPKSMERENKDLESSPENWKDRDSEAGEEKGEGFGEHHKKKPIVSTVKEKVEGGFFGFINRGKKTDSQQEKEREKEKLDKMAKDVKRSVDNLYSSVRNLQQQDPNARFDYILPAHFEEVLESLSEIYVASGDLDKILRKHTRDIENAHHERTRYWDFWSRILKNKPEYLSKFNQSRFIHSSIHSVDVHPPTDNELNSLRELFSMCFNNDVDVENLTNLIPNLRVVNGLIINDEQSRNIKDGMAFMRRPTETYSMDSIENGYGDVEKHQSSFRKYFDQWRLSRIEVVDKFKSTSDKYDRAVQGLRNELANLDKEIDSTNQRIRSNNAEIGRLVEKMDDLKRQNVHLENKLVQDRRTKDNKSKDDRPDLSLKTDLDNIKNKKGLYVKFGSQMDTFSNDLDISIIEYKRSILQRLDELIDEMENDPKDGDELGKHKDRVARIDRFLNERFKMDDDEQRNRLGGQFEQIQIKLDQLKNPDHQRPRVGGENQEHPSQEHRSHEDFPEQHPEKNEFPEVPEHNPSHEQHHEHQQPSHEQHHEHQEEQEH